VSNEPKGHPILARAAAVGRAVLIVDEADDLATGRNQTPAHHEDRAGVNVLIKQINQLMTSPAPVALIIITNRADVLDPAVLRRAALQLIFERPNEKARFAVFQRILEGTDSTVAQIHELAKLTEHNIPYTYSDLTDRAASPSAEPGKTISLSALPRLRPQSPKSSRRRG
jgi:SpoVK/Ycf46/Vps4 family AAA+-type ATPase